MTFSNDNLEFLKTFIQYDLCLKNVSETEIKAVFDNPSVKWFTQGHTLNLSTLANNTNISQSLYDIIGIVLVGMKWPTPNDSIEFIDLFQKRINQKNYMIL